MTGVATPRPLVIKVDATHHPSDAVGDRFRAAGFQVVKAASIREGIRLARRCKPNLVVTLDDPTNGLDAVEWLALQHSDSEATLAMTPLLILAEDRHAERLRVHELPDRVKILTHPLEMHDLVYVASQMLSVWNF